VRVADELRRREPDLPILLGGPHATVLDRQIMEAFTPFDVIVRHEAEDTIVPVLDALERRSFGAIPGVTYRTGRTALSVRANPGAPKIDNLDTLPFPAYDLTPIDDLQLPYLRIEAGRGCPWACTFCSTASFFQRSYRLKSSDRLVTDLDRLHDRYGHTHFKLEHDLFTVNKRKVRAFCDAVRDRHYTWMASARIDCVDVELLETMADAGCRELYFGVETGSPQLQLSLQKRLDLDLLLPTLRAAADLGIEATTSFITGFPEEQRTDRDDTLRLMGTLLGDIEPAPVVQLHLLMPEPGTGQFHAHAPELALDDYVAEFNAEPNVEDRPLIAAHPQIFATYHHYPGAIDRAEQIAVVELTRQLVALGPVVLRYLLTVSGTDLACLVRSLQDDVGADDGWSLAPAIERRFGRQHVVTSLVRLTLAAASADVAPSNPPSIDHLPQRLVIAPHAVVLGDLHDCGAIIDHLLGTPDAALGTDLQTSVSDYVIVRRAGGPQVFEIDPVTRLVTSAFSVPSTPAELEQQWSEALGRPIPVSEIAERLWVAGVLVEP
jgi:radical SAM superfamily enzyme YgiQ (UPF0313 family)